MSRPWSKKRVADQAATPLAVVESEQGTLRRPLDPSLPRRLSAEESRDAVNKVVTELHAQGALDAGNADVLDGWIDSLRPQWQAHSTMASTEHEAVTQLVVGDSEAAAVAARQRAVDARADVEHIQRLIGAFEGALLPDNGPEQPDRRHRRPDLERLEGLTESTWQKVGRFGLLCLVGAGDLATFYLTLAVLFQQQEWLTWVLVGSFTVASMTLMHAAGHTAKNIREGQGGLPGAAVGAMALAWAALGGVAFYVRLNFSEPVASTTEVAFGADPAAAAASGPSPILSAVLLAGLFIASGVLAFWIGFSHHPRMTAYRSLRTQLVDQRAKAAAAEQAAIAAERLLANAQAEQARAAQRAADAVRSIGAEITELKELTRLHLAGLLGEPASTNAVTTGRGAGPSTEELEAVQVGESDHLDLRPNQAMNLLPREAADALQNGGGHVNGVPQQSANR